MARQASVGPGSGARRLGAGGRMIRARCLDGVSAVRLRERAGLAGSAAPGVGRPGADSGRASRWVLMPPLHGQTSRRVPGGATGVWAAGELARAPGTGTMPRRAYHGRRRRSPWLGPRGSYSSTSPGARLRLRLLPSDPSRLNERLRRRPAPCGQAPPRPVMFFFSNRLGCLGSVLISAIGTLAVRPVPGVVNLN